MGDTPNRGLNALIHNSSLDKFQNVSGDFSCSDWIHWIPVIFLEELPERLMDFEAIFRGQKKEKIRIKISFSINFFFFFFFARIHLYSDSR